MRRSYGTAQLGARRRRELCERYGTDTVRAAVDSMVEYAKRRFETDVPRLASDPAVGI